jgi:sodium-dependent dicarboxylate transporter 2/3/5
MLVVVTIIIFLTELTSNAATVSAFVPVIAALAVALDIDPMMLAAPAAMAASCAFMLPVATPPNSIVFGSGYIQVPQMVRAGVVLNLIGIVVVTVFGMVLIPLVFA